MQFGLAGARKGAEEGTTAEHPKIRFYGVGQRASYAAGAIDPKASANGAFADAATFN
ncbi:MAG: hypothetical protein WAO35_10200 [Terriglobia bacterium]